MRYLHTMVRVKNLEESLDFYCNKMGLQEVRRMESEGGRFTLVFLVASADKESAVEERAPLLELTYNWDPEDYTGGRNFGHLAYEVDDIYTTCQSLMDNGITINRARHVTAEWHSSDLLTAFLSNCCRKARLWR